MSILTAVQRAFAWLLGTRGQAIYRATFRTHSWSDLCAQIEGSVRACSSGDDGFVLHVKKQPYSFLIWAYLGMTSGFSIHLIAKREADGEGDGLIFVSRWSRLDTWRVYVATGGFFMTVLTCCVIIWVTGWQLPGIGYIILGISIGVTVAISRLLHPVIATMVYLRGERLTDNQIATVAGNRSRPFGQE